MADDSSRDRLDKVTGVPQIEVTPEMLEAAVKVFRESGIVDECSEVDKLVVREMLEASLQVLRGLSPVCKQ